MSRILLCCILMIIWQSILAQKKAKHPGKINLNQLILDVSNQGERASNTSDYLLAEKYLKHACELTDTLIIYLANPDQIKNEKFYFSKKQIRTYVFAYEKLATLYMMAGNFKKAEELFSKSLKQRQLIFTTRSVHRIYPYIGLGQLYFLSGDTDKALSFFSEASILLDQATTTNFNYDGLRHQLYGFHFEVSLEKRRMKEAWKFLSRYFYSLNTVSPSLEQVAGAFEMRSRYFLIAGNPELAFANLKRAEGVLPFNQGIFSKSQVKILRTKAIYYWSKNNIDSTSAIFQRLLNSYELNIQKNFPSMSEYEREQFFITLKKDFDLFNSFVAAEILSNKKVNHLLELLYDTQLFTKALLLNEIAKTKKNLIESKDQSLIEKVNQWQNAKNQIASLYYNNKNASASISQLEQQINTLEKEINASSSFFNKTDREVRWNQVRDQLKKNEAAAEIIRVKSFNPDAKSSRGLSFTDSVYYLFLIIHPNSTSPEAFILKDGVGMETRYLSNYRNSIRQELRDTLSYNHFWKPLHNHLPDCAQLFLSADGVYNQINLNVLQNPQSGKYVLDEINLYFVTNTKDLLLTHKASQKNNAYLFGHPSYSTSSKKSSSEVERSGNIRALGDRDLIHFTQQEFADLPSTEKEIEVITDLLKTKQWTLTSFKNEEASEENLKSSRSPTVLHLATHGFFLVNDGAQVNSMIRSGIILSGVKNHQNQQEDGILTAYEATNLALEGTELVVLSACETGLGEVKNGEGVYGLQRGLKVAGAKNLLMSLWKVDDEATAQLMIDFYQAWLDGTEIHAAFKQAQLRLREKYPNPYYWGAFILSGN